MQCFLSPTETPLFFACEVGLVFDSVPGAWWPPLPATFSGTSPTCAVCSLVRLHRSASAIYHCQSPWCIKTRRLRLSLLPHWGVATAIVLCSTTDLHGSSCRTMCAAATGCADFRRCAVRTTRTLPDPTPRNVCGARRRLPWAPQQQRGHGWGRASTLSLR
jgi:hypothetical protein